MTTKPMEKTTDELVEYLRDVHEKYIVELKQASDLPKSFWESYSAFSNTAGGLIILGVQEGQPHNELVGVGNAQKIITNLWNQLSNPNKVSYRTISNEDIQVCSLSDKQFIFVTVHEAPDIKKPVYLNDHLDDTYIRTGDGDRKATKEEIEAMARNSSPVNDSLAAINFTISDLDSEALAFFKASVAKRYPTKSYEEMDDQTFLSEIGAAETDRKTGVWCPKRGTVLFLGKVNSIKEIYPQFHLDYFNKQGNNPRWSDRVSDDEPADSEINIYNFYRIVFEKLRALPQQPFSLDNEQTRLPLPSNDESLREALVNCLAHADYVQGYPSTKIEAHDGWFRFLNPGKMLVRTEQFFAGGNSIPRNEIVMKLFRYIGASERQGFGGPVIVKAAVQNKFRYPEVDSDLNHTELRIWRVDLVDSYPELTADERTVLSFILKSTLPQSITDIFDATGITKYKIHKALDKLVNDYSVLNIVGHGPSTKYVVKVERPEKFTQLQVAMEKIKLAYNQ